MLMHIYFGECKWCIKNAKNQRERKIEAATTTTMKKEIEQTNQQQNSKQQALQRLQSHTQKSALNMCISSS